MSISSTLFGQYDSLFEKHLYNKALRGEHLAYFSELKNTSSDSLQFLRSRYHLHYQEDSLFLTSFSALDLNFQVQLVRRGTEQLLHSNDALREQWFAMPVVQHSLGNEAPLMNVYNAGKQPQAFRVEQFPEELHYSFARLQKFDKRSPWKSAALAAVLPGSGRIYSGRPKSFISTFTTVMLLAAQSEESIRKYGIKHPLSITMLTGFSIFYVGNIYGSYRDLKKVKQENIIQFYHDASNYYSRR
jgi:hypothetical protein